MKIKLELTSIATISKIMRLHSTSMVPLRSEKLSDNSLDILRTNLKDPPKIQKSPSTVKLTGLVESQSVRAHATNGPLLKSQPHPSITKWPNGLNLSVINVDRSSQKSENPTLSLTTLS